MAVGGDAFRESAAHVGLTPEYQVPGWLNTASTVADGMPGLSQSAAFSSLRTGNTILGGGFDDIAGRAPNYRGGKITGGMLRNNNPIRPRSWTRYASQEDIAGVGKYSPFQANRAVNWAARNNLLGSSLKKAYDVDGTVMSGGMLGRTKAAGAIFRGADITSAAKFLDISGMSAANSSRSTVGHALLMSGKGAVSQGIGGFLSGSRFLANGAHATEFGSMMSGAKSAAARKGIAFAGKLGSHAALEAGETQLVRGAGRAIAKQTGKGMVRSLAVKGGAKTVGKVLGSRLALASAAAATGPAAPFLEAALLAWTAVELGTMTYDLGKQAIKGTITTGLQGAKSFRGDFGKGIFGNTYVDTEAAATSRQRGVMAIQNSRLNARSILGNEGGMMAAHFG